MPEILVISGKGGTGKTSITAALAHLANGCLICDLDVDAPDLHLILDPQHIQEEDFYSGHLAEIDQDLCNQCGTCHEMCRYGAIEETESGYRIEPLHCEGCKVCVQFCPQGAVKFPERHCGAWYVSNTRMGKMVHAQLFPGQENSGRLVSLIRQKARELSNGARNPLIISDGPPGIGCPVISSLSGVNYAVLVTEPTPSGLHDLERVVDLCGHFKVPGGVIINKHDLSPDYGAKIEALAQKMGLDLLGRLPYSRQFTEAMLQRKAVNELGPSDISQSLEDSWSKVLQRVASTQK